MKCIGCNTDSKLKDRTDGKCPKCATPFVFEPAGTRKDPVTDMLFKNAIEAVSSGGRIRWGVEHLYYEVARRKRVTFKPIAIFFLVFATVWFGGFVGGITSIPVRSMLPRDTPIWWWFAVVASVPSLWALWYYRYHGKKPFPDLDRMAFGRLWDRWIEVQGRPAGLIVRQGGGDAGLPGTLGRKPVTPELAAPARRGVQTVSVSASAPAFGRRRQTPAGNAGPGTVPARVRERDVGD